MKPDYIENDHRLWELRAVKQDWGDNMEPGKTYVCWMARYLDQNHSWWIDTGVVRAEETHWSKLVKVSSTTPDPLGDLCWEHAWPNAEGAVRAQIQACARLRMRDKKLWELLGTLLE